MTLEWISALTNIAVAIGILVTVWQLITSQQQVEMLRRQIADSHDRSHRNEAIRAIAVWKRNLDKAGASAVTLVASFSITQCQMLKQCKPFEVDACYAKLIEQSMQELVVESQAIRTPVSTAPILLNKQYLSQLYRFATEYLNSIEICLQHWMLGTADRGVIETELHSLVTPEHNELVLDNFRIVLGGARAYPAIDAFLTHFTEKPPTTTRQVRATYG